MPKKFMILLCGGYYTLLVIIFSAVGFSLPSFAANSTDYQAVPPFVTAGVPPLVMLVMGRNHKLYYEAYNDASDLNNDGSLDVGYNPAIEYYGYFDSYKYYEYSSTNSRFEPVGIVLDKKAPSGNFWSGDFLNYLTMTRMDCMRKVLYGGFRSTDTSTETVLQRVFVPQDAHSWGKEYKDIANDGYNIEDYTPLSLPVSGTRHLFANTTLSDNGPPLLRVLPDNTHRIWEWVAKERPVCDNSLVTGGGLYTSHPSDHADYNAMVTQFAVTSQLQGSWTNTMIDSDHDNLTDSNPYDSNNDNYMTIFTGTINVLTDDTYKFAVDGDDAVEVIIDGVAVAGWYGGHGKCNCDTHRGSIALTAGNHTIEYRHEEASGSDNYYLYWNQGNIINTWQIVPSTRFPSGLTQDFYTLELPGSTITDYEVRVKVCDPAIGVEPNSKLYPSGAYKPIGILQRHGESDRMYFGLLTGSYTKNTSGGVLRKNIRSIKDEINSSTGEFLYLDTAVKGIIKTIDTFRIVDFDYGSQSYSSNCGWVTTRPINEGECRMWGNPVAEMMYESLRYFAGTKIPTGEFTYDATASHDDNELDLPKPGWLNPYMDSEDINLNGVLDAGEDTNGNGVLDGFDYCAKPFLLVLSDINPTYDSDQLPGSAFGSVSSTLTGLDVETLGNAISTQEGSIGTHFIGEAASYNGACTPKTIPGFGTIRGLCPEEPTKGGSYYSASVAYHGNKEDLSAASQSQNVSTYCVGLASPLPNIEIPVGASTITLVPFAKSVGGYSISANEGDFQPTNTIVDFFVEEITSTYGKFRINYEDVEQGADHDMDAIVEYEYQVVDASDNPVTDPALGEKVIITLNSTYAAGSIIQHMGYIISGTTNDGTFLEVRDEDTGAGSDPDYFLDTPPGIDPGGAWNDGTALPLTSTRTFQPGAATAATLLKTPLWYAAKWGGFEDYNNNNLPDLANEWDKDADGVPDTYFYVQNPLRLEEQLNRSFADILRRTASGTAASVISQTRSGEGAVYQAVFYPEFKGPLGNTIKWVGELHSLLVDSYGNMREDTNGNATLDSDEDRVIVFDGNIIYKYHDDDGNDIIDETQTPEFTGTIMDVKYLWSSSNWLNEMSDAEAAAQRIYNTATRNRYVFTFVDVDQDMVADPGEQVDFKCESLPSTANLINTSTIYPYLSLFPTFEDEPTISYGGGSIAMDTFRSSATEFNDFLVNQSSRVVNYIRGVDQPSFYSGTTPSYILPEFRSRQVDYDDDGTVETWRMGDIVYSTPTIVGRPTENYHLLYRDLSYATFADRFKNRRHVVYTGGNDGMFHAFNAGFYDSVNKGFKKSFKTGTDQEIEYDLGSELWAYVPYNLLPHLSWLTETDYPHVYYCDLKPKVFDAKVLPDGSFDWNNDGFINAGDQDGEPDWGTFLVAGMRLGGGEIIADMNKIDGNTANAIDRSMSSAYFILDITDPESPPKVLAEIRMEGLGYTTCYPAVIPMKDKRDISVPANGEATINENEWYLVFGSGPASSTGHADANGLSGALEEAISRQTSKLYIVDLKKLVFEGTLETLDSLGVFTAAPAAAGLHDYYQELDANSFISDPISVDFNLDYNADAVYFGTVSGNSSSSVAWGGKLRRIVIDNDMDFANWDGDSVFMDLEPVPVTGLDPAPGQPIVTAPSVGIDNQNTRWVFFGTGRFFVRSDAANADQQSYYGIKEPFTDTNSNGVWDFADTNLNGLWDEGEVGEPMTWSTVAKSTIVDVSMANVDDEQNISGVTGIIKWDKLVEEVEKNTVNGWGMDFIPVANKERNLGQATLLGELLTFTTYIPSADICSFEGDSSLYALYYKTGTAYFESVIGYIDANANGTIETTETQLLKKISLGKGLAVTPNIHVGKQDGSKAFVQTSTGAIKTIEQKNPGATKSGVTSWEDVE